MKYKKVDLSGGKSAFYRGEFMETLSLQPKNKVNRDNI